MRIAVSLVTGLALIAASATVAEGAIGVESVVLEYQTEITSMDLTGTFLLPLGPEFGLVNSTLTLSESANYESTGKASAFFQFRPGGGTPATVDEIQDGDHFFVDSFFDVFFDITVEDVDPANDFHPGFGGSVLSLPSDGTNAAHMELISGDEIGPAADTSKPNFGLFPLEGDVYIGHVDVVIPLPFSVGGDPDENDVLKFQFTTHNVGGVQDTFLMLPDGSVVESFDSSAPFAGSIFDESVDPPFGPFMLTGPTTATSLGPQPAGIPEPTTLIIWSLLGALGIAYAWRRRKR